MEILPSLPSFPAAGAPPAADNAAGADDPFLALLVGLLMPASPAPASAGAAIDQPPTGCDGRMAAGVAARATELPAPVDTAPEPCAQLIPEVEELATASPEPCASTTKPLLPTTFIQAPPAAENQHPDQPVDGGAPAVPAAAEPQARTAAGRPSGDEHEDRKDGPETPEPNQVEPATDRVMDAGTAAPPAVDVPTAADSGQSATNVTIPVGTPGATGQPQKHAAAIPMERLAPTVFTMPDAQGREVTARLVVSGGTDGQPLRIEVQPADLGRVEVSLRLHDSGAAAASFTVDRLETLQLLQRDAHTVTAMLTAAGFTVDQGSLAFTLRDGGSDQGRSRQQPTEQPRHSWHQQQPDQLADEPRGRPRRSLLDLRV